MLTCTDPVLAQRVASVLSVISLTGGGTATDAEAEEILADLPAAPAASFREAWRQLRDQQWPEADTSPVSWGQFRACDEEDLTPARRDEEARTPSDARLGQLTGKVFRVIQFGEYHVYDADRLLKAASADGWSPLSDEEDEVDPDDDLLDALMHMADISDEVPGADIICQESRGEMLVVGKGAELADWKQEPITVQFGTGWRLRSEESQDLRQIRPDFTALFPVRSCDCDREDCEICGDWQLTPRTADMLYTSLQILSDQAYDDVDERGDDPVSGKDDNDWWFFDRLPRITWHMNAAWRRQIGHACEDLARDLAAGQWPSPRNNAEEIVLHLAIRDAPDCLEMAEDAGDSDHDALPRNHDDYDWDMCSEILFEDHDVLMLYNADLDGMEDPDTDVNQEFGIGDLRPKAWFEFFAHLEPRDPARSFRRG